MSIAEDDSDLAVAAINAASFGAANAVYDYANEFERREDYRPLEELAQRVAKIALEAGSRAINERTHESRS